MSFHSSSSGLLRSEAISFTIYIPVIREGKNSTPVNNVIVHLLLLKLERNEVPIP